jgi:transposase
VVWRPPVQPSPAEQAVIKAVRRAKLFVFLREHRRELFSEEFQAELAETYVDSPKGQPPVPPAQLALATILQAYTGVSDDEVIEAAIMDRRWQLVLDCMGAEEPPFSKGTLVGFRKRLIERNLDRRLVERTVELAAATGEFGSRALRAALDSSPLWGAGRVEDTVNLMGHALRKALGVIAAVQGRGRPQGPPWWRRRPGCRSWPPRASRRRWILTGMTRPPGTRRWPRCWACWTRSRRSSPAWPAIRLRPRRWRPPARSATRTWT